MTVVALGHDVDGLLARGSLCPTFSVIVPHALGSRAFMLGVKQKNQNDGIEVEEKRTHEFAVKPTCVAV